MTDFPYVGPPTGGLELAFATARGRRYRKAGLSTGATAFTLAVAALLAGSTGRTTLVQEPAPEIPAVTSVDRVPSGTIDAPTANTTSVGAIAQFGSTSSMTGAPNSRRTPTGPVAVAGVTPVSRAGDPGSVTAPSAPYRSAAMKRDDGNSFYIPTQYRCAVKDDGSGARTSPLCPSAYVGGPSSPDKPFSLQSQVCSSDTKATRLSYATSREVDLTIYKGTTAVWRWSATQEAPTRSPHQLTLNGTSCYTWTTEWTGVDNAGEKLAKGQGYRMVASFAAAEVADFPTYEFTFSIS